MWNKQSRFCRRAVLAIDLPSGSGNGCNVLADSAKAPLKFGPFCRDW
jgi:hypothetical protein